MVITDNPQSIVKKTYLLSYLIPLWTEKGITIEISTPQNCKDADLAVLHVDLTNVPELYSQACQKYPAVLNGSFLNSAKSVISHQLITPEDHYEGPVIIKTEANFGGIPEYLLKKQTYPSYTVKPAKSILLPSMVRFLNNAKSVISHQLITPEDHYEGPVIIKTEANFGGILEYLLKKQNQKTATDNTPDDKTEVTWDNVEAIPPEQYPVLKSISLVPDAVWNNPHLVVEKFLPERDEKGLYILRGCLFFGDKEVNLRVKSKFPVVKGSGIIEREILKSDTPNQLKEMRKALKIDFGRLDYVINNGNIVLYDVNKTATLSHQASIEWADQILLPLSSGIEAYL